MAINPEMLSKVKSLEVEIVRAIRSGDLPTYIHAALRKPQNDYDLNLTMHALFAQSGISGGHKRVAQTAGMLRDIAGQIGVGERVDHLILQVSCELAEHIMRGAYVTVESLCRSLDVPVPVFMCNATDVDPEAQAETPEWARNTVGGVH